MPEERNYLKRAAASLDSIMKRPFEPSGYDRRPVGRSARRKLQDTAKDNKRNGDQDQR